MGQVAFAADPVEAEPEPAWVFVAEAVGHWDVVEAHSWEAEREPGDVVVAAAVPSLAEDRHKEIHSCVVVVHYDGPCQPGTDEDC